MTDTTFIICCSNPGEHQHGRIERGRVERAADGTLTPVLVVEQGGKARPGSWHDSTFGRRELAANPELYADVKPVARPIRDDHDGRAIWRFPPCPGCGRELPSQSDPRMRKVLDHLVLTELRVVEIKFWPK